MRARSWSLCSSWNGVQHDCAFTSSAYPGMTGTCEMADQENIVFPGLKDRVVIVTGAGQGIGRVVAKSFAMAGARAVIAEQNEKKAAAVSEEIMASGGKALAVTTDVADPASIKEMVEVVEDEHGRIDVLIQYGPSQHWRCVLSIKSHWKNGTESFVLILRAISLCTRRSPGNAAGGMGPHHQYCIWRCAPRPAKLSTLHSEQGRAGRGALSMARELGADGITVNAILPGATFTEIERETVTPVQKERIISMQCIPRAEVPEDLVGAVLFLASEASAFVTGQSINLDGGVTGS